MAKCAYCRKKKAKRTCPGLNGTVCPLCCGTHRQKEIRCTQDCSYLHGKQTYFQEKAFDQFAKAFSPFLEEKLLMEREDDLDLLHTLFVAVARYFRRNPSAKDVEVLDGVTYALQQLSPILLLDPVKTELGETLAQGMEFLVKDRDVPKSKLEEILKYLEEFVQGYSPEASDSNRFFSGVMSFVEKFSPGALEADLGEDENQGGLIQLPGMH